MQQRRSRWSELEVRSPWVTFTTTLKWLLTLTYHQPNPYLDHEPHLCTYAVTTETALQPAVEDATLLLREQYNFSVFYSTNNFFKAEMYKK